LPSQLTIGVKFCRPPRFTHQIYLAEDLSRQAPDVVFGYGLEW